MPTIFKGAHRAWPLSLGIWYKKKDVTKLVTFDDTCAYSIEGEDMYDINKLFGIGYFFSPHTDSARFGWRYNDDTDLIELFAYCYVNKELVDWYLGDLIMGRQYFLSITIRDGRYEFLAVDIKLGRKVGETTIKKKHQKKFSYPMSLFFGGQKRAPHKIKVKFEKA